MEIKLKQIIFALALIAVTATLLHAFTGTSPSYRIDAWISESGFVGESTSYKIYGTLTDQPVGIGSSSSYFICLGHYCEGEVITATPTPEPCNPTTPEWTIALNKNVLCEDEIIEDVVNLTVNGILTFKNVSLKLAGENNGDSVIKVSDYGSFYVFDKDERKDTQDDASEITHADASTFYFFQVLDTAKAFELKNSKVSNVGYKTGATGDEMRGIYIEADNAEIINNSIENGYYGIVLTYSNNHLIENNEITSNDINQGIGLKIYSSNSSNLTNNNIMNVTHGIYVVYSKENIVNGGSIYGSTESIYVSHNYDDLNVSNVLTQDVDGLGAIYLFEDANVTLVNTSFDKENAFVGSNSRLETKWFLDVFVHNEDGQPVEGATITVESIPYPDVTVVFTTDEYGMPWAKGTQAFTEFINTTIVGYDYEKYAPYNITAFKNPENSTEWEGDESSEVDIELPGVSGGYGCVMTLNPGTGVGAFTSEVTITFDLDTITSADVDCGTGTTHDDVTVVNGVAVVNCDYPQVLTENLYALETTAFGAYCNATVVDKPKSVSSLPVVDASINFSNAECPR
ncbi:right-handed parallel beta-helix repeat-containing protein, partial [Candidatus Micrarchaeota archaeon]|nr:right-handed parallel beta-helix repeat-containing protein [Candidatus Micrarchaeota archaeon]